MPELNSCADLKTGVHQGVTYHTNVLNNTVYSYECVSGFIPDGILAEGAVLCKEEHFKLAFTDTNGDFIPQPRCKINIGIAIGYGLAGVLLITGLIFLLLCVKYKRRLSSIYQNSPKRRRRLSLPTTTALDKQEFDERYPQLPRTSHQHIDNQSSTSNPPTIAPVPIPRRFEPDITAVIREPHQSLNTSTLPHRPTPCQRSSRSVSSNHAERSSSHRRQRPPSEPYQLPIHTISHTTNGPGDIDSEASSTTSYGRPVSNSAAHSPFPGRSADIITNHMGLTMIGVGDADPITGTHFDDNGYAEPNFHANPVFEGDTMSKCSSFATLDLDNYPSLAQDLGENWKIQRPYDSHGQLNEAPTLRVRSDRSQQHLYDQVPSETDDSPYNARDSMLVHI